VLLKKNPLIPKYIVNDKKNKHIFIIRILKSLNRQKEKIIGCFVFIKDM
jgi:hypothetical protein